MIEINIEKPTWYLELLFTWYFIMHIQLSIQKHLLQTR